jgi:hypothetical protein
MEVKPNPYTGERPKTMAETESAVPRQPQSKGGTVMAWVLLVLLVALAVVVGLGGDLF